MDDYLAKSKYPNVIADRVTGTYTVQTYDGRVKTYTSLRWAEEYAKKKFQNAALMKYKDTCMVTKMRPWTDNIPTIRIEKKEDFEFFVNNILCNMSAVLQECIAWGLRLTIKNGDENETK